ncbi:MULTISPECIES: DUF5789 family protein [Haloferax]|uniref:DUF2795 domain-containing protein n=2 Tax=Haloferax gibbonsii TaxID=35746 RepID=A0A0K1IVW7_HALGI|nr:MULTISPECIES: hypothetical protein [Haloferax]AKU08438.1 hypothetical protein ABY42_12090 [Haloferax gibbonsii]ELZ80705.1 hypothetical protein C454_10381 [Haloferax gibbonsii ATCC 33959]QOS12412.1 uncharacterized protein HfgLR_11375 [Haloferax gibbonsii]RDZ52428.1 hypothetical protein C5C07_11640 [Haloferax sp. Atlit-4N]REA03601.1 hypothetical protein DEQ92_10830 [Haloferax sp. Atlit-6N]
MDIRDLQSHLETAFEYPVATDRVLERVGDIEVTAPNVDDAETVEAILDPLGAETYESAADLYNTILGSVSDDYIGRKFYDDRGADPADSWSILPEQARSF